MIIGCTGVNFGAGATQKVQVSAVFRRVKVDGSPYKGRFSKALDANQINEIDQAASTLNVPLLYIPDHVAH